MTLTHLIEIPDRAEYERAMAAFLTIRGRRLVLPGNRMVVTEEHLKALKQAGVKFTPISRSGPAPRGAGFVTPALPSRGARGRRQSPWPPPGRASPTLCHRLAFLSRETCGDEPSRQEAQQKIPDIGDVGRAVRPHTTDQSSAALVRTS